MHVFDDSFAIAFYTQNLNLHFIFVLQYKNMYWTETTSLIVSFHALLLSWTIFGLTDGAQQQNVYGNALELCSNDPLTGWYRDGYCNTDNRDGGSHVVCAGKGSLGHGEESGTCLLVFDKEIKKKNAFGSTGRQLRQCWDLG